ncbi:DUF397 domain-containing protein [Streptomyces sp. NPDC002133]|uniref:DUF397 domain-containing protein n=1 Tax=Streptomyces sp. NPDC002133 TaxID=3154409 RepID=UPI00331AA6AC
MSTTELDWFKSSHSGGEGGESLEVAGCPTTIHVRDSKNLTGPRLAFTRAHWDAFVTSVRGS